jgi:hypothetical protein
MARVTVKVSDMTGNQIPDEQAAARLVVEHPDFSEPIGMDVLPDDVLPHLTDENARFVVLSYYDPGDPDPIRYVMLLEDFDNLFGEADSTTALQQALQTQQQEQETETLGRRGRGRRATAGTKPRIDYTSPEHAGEPHRGTISEAEKAYVRVHLDEVNERLRANGQREIDPDDPEMAQRYGFVPPPSPS